MMDCKFPVSMTTHGAWGRGGGQRAWGWGSVHRARVGAVCIEPGWVQSLGWGGSGGYANNDVFVNVYRQ